MPPSAHSDGGATAKLNDGRSFVWQDKERCRAILTNTSRRERRLLLAIYQVLTLIANDAGHRRFSTHIASLASEVGSSRKSAANALRRLEELRLISVRPGGRSSEGLFSPIEVELTKGSYRTTSQTIEPRELSSYESAHGQNGLSKPSGLNALASAGQKHPWELSYDQSSHIKRTKKEQRTEEDARAKNASEPTLKPSQAALLFEQFWPIDQTKNHELVRLMGIHGEEAVLDAIRDAALRESGEERLKHPILMVRTLLESPKSQRQPGAPPQPKLLTEAERWWNEQAIYRNLSINGSPYVRENLMRNALARYGVDLEIDFQHITPKDFVLQLYRKAGAMLPDFIMPLADTLPVAHTASIA